jgi:hypothetical protein
MSTDGSAVPGREEREKERLKGSLQWRLDIFNLRHLENKKIKTFGQSKIICKYSNLLICRKIHEKC